MIKAAYDPYLPAFAVLIPGLVVAFDSAGENYPELQAPVNMLRNWNYHVAADSIAMTLAHFYGMQYLEDGGKPDGFSQMQRIQMYGTSTPYFERLDIFEKVINMLNQDFGTWQTPWWQVNRFQRLSGDIDQAFDDNKPSTPIAMASGRWGALAAYGAKRQNTKKLYGYRGNSFVAVVEFGEKVKAKSLLAGGQSGHADSPHFNDQVPLYAEAIFKPVAFYREEVEKRATEAYAPGFRYAEQAEKVNAAEVVNE